MKMATHRYIEQPSVCKSKLFTRTAIEDFLLNSFFDGALEKNPKIIEMLINNGANIEAVTKDVGRTPLNFFVAFEDGKIHWSNYNLTK